MNWRPSRLGGRAPAALSAMLLTAWTAYAGDAAARVRVGPQAAPARPDAAGDDPAEAAPTREAKPRAVAVRAGYFGGALFGGGLEGLWSADAWELGGAAFYGAADVTGVFDAQLTQDAALSGYHVDALTLTSTSAMLEARRHLDGSFAITAGAGYRRLAGHLQLSTPDAGGQLTAAATADSVVVSVAAGNFWAWRNGFSAGIDWIGLTVPLASTTHIAVQRDGSASLAAQGALRSQAEAATKALAQAPGVILLLGSLGCRF